MTTTPPEASSDSSFDSGDPGNRRESGSRATRAEIRNVGRIRRTVADRKIAGVAGGLARHLDIDPIIVRVALVVLVFFGGAGLLVYGACWLLIPEDGAAKAPLGLDERSRTVALVIAGVLAVLALIGDSWGVIGFPWPAAIIGVIVLLILTRRDKGASTPPSAPGSLPGYAAPTYTAPRNPRNPRKRGPILVWFTLALIALCIGLLGIADLAGAAVANPAYPALAVGVVALMLIIGAFYGRAGGIIALGFVASLVLAGTTAAGQIDGDQVRETPLSAAAVARTYDIGAGELVLDLREVRDVEALDGRLVHLSGDLGHIRVIVPSGVNVEVRADINGPGNIALFGSDQGGVGTSSTRSYDGGVVAPTIRIVAELGVGEIEVISEGSAR